MACDIPACQALFSDPIPYLGGAAVNAAVATATAIANPLTAAVIGAPFGPIAVFIYNSMDFLGNSTEAKAARAACAFFGALLLSTLVTAAFGCAITLAHGTLLLIAGVAAVVGTALLMTGRR
jgi:hypothetical protein